MTRCAAFVDVGAYGRNLQSLRDFVGRPIYAVLKADAYGHGAVDLAHAARKVNGVVGFCVATFSEGAELRSAGIDDTVIVLTPVEDPQAAFDYGLSVSVSTDEQLMMVASAPAEKRPEVHIEVDSGMHRMGVAPDLLGRLVEKAGDRGVRIAGIYTHFSSADETSPEPTRVQLKAFLQALKEIEPPMVHVANSAGAIRFPVARFDAVRLGGATFGLSTGADEIFEMTEPILRLEARILRILEVRAGEGLGYGLCDFADNDRQIAIVAIGYGDGYPRALSFGAPVLVAGRLCRTAGRISMDFTAVDITGVDAVPGDNAILIGHDGRARIRAEDLASFSGTISYEITTGLLPRVPRFYSGRIGQVMRDVGSVTPARSEG